MIDWSHTTLETVQRVVTYLYFDDYDSPDPVPIEGKMKQQNLNGDLENLKEGRVRRDGHLDETTKVPEPEDLDLQNAIMESCSIRPLTPFSSCVRLGPLITLRLTAGGAFQEQKFPYQTHSYQETLMAHAEVYVFAESHFLPRLQELALQRMVQTLNNVECTAKHAAQELSDVAVYVYDNTPAKNGDSEPMRKILSQFIATNYTSLFHDSFEKIMTRGGDFTLDLGRKLSRHISAHINATRLKEEKLHNRIEKLESELRNQRLGTKVAVHKR